MAAYKDASDVAKQLMAGGADVNAANKDGYTPLHMAAYKDASNVAKLLIAGGADVNAADNDGETPLDLALSKGRLRMQEFLRRHDGKCAKRRC